MRKSWWLLVVALIACGGEPVGPQSPPPPPPPPPPPGTLRILFIGNSLTYTYNVPQLVRQMAVAAGKPAPVVVSRAYANYGLEDHWNDGPGAVRNDLKVGAYHLAIVQQGPSTVAESGVNLTYWVGRFGTEASQYGTRLGVYGVAAPVGSSFEGGMNNYRNAAIEAGAAFYPVSHAWKEAWRLEPSMPLYGPDEFHPSQHGAWLAALVITGIAFDVPVGNLPNPFPGIITDQQAATLRAAAATTITAFGRP